MLISVRSMKTCLELSIFIFLSQSVSGTDPDCFQMKIESSRQTFTEQTNERTKISIYWAPVGAKNPSRFSLINSTIIKTYNIAISHYLSDGPTITNLSSVQMGNF